MLRVRLEQLADEALGRVSDDADPAARSTDTGELLGGLLLVGREHRTEDGSDDVETGVVEGQRLGVAFDELRLQTLGVGTPTRPVQQRRNVVDPDERAAPPSGGECGVSAAGGDIEDSFGRTHVERFDEQLRDDHDLGSDHVVIAARPSGSLALLDRCEVRGGGGHLRLLIALDALAPLRMTVEKRNQLHSSRIYRPTPSRDRFTHEGC